MFDLTVIHEQNPDKNSHSNRYYSYNTIFIVYVGHILSLFLCVHVCFYDKDTKSPAGT